MKLNCVRSIITDLKCYLSITSTHSSFSVPSMLSMEKRILKGSPGYIGDMDPLTLFFP